MTVLEPGELPEVQFPEDEAPVAVVAPAPVLEPGYRDVCSHCKRSILEVGEAWVHWDPRVDQPSNPAHHVAELFVEEPVKWGHLTVRGRNDFGIEPSARGSRGGQAA